MFFLGHWCFFKVDALEESERQELDENTPEELTCTKDQANTILPHCKWEGLGDLATNFNHCHLNDEG
jgi:hypothetical protein